MTCFICGGKLHKREDDDYDCDGCRRTLYKLGESWATRKTKVRVKKTIQPGDAYDNCIRVLEKVTLKTDEEGEIRDLYAVQDRFAWVSAKVIGPSGMIVERANLERML